MNSKFRISIALMILVQSLCGGPLFFAYKKTVLSEKKCELESQKRGCVQIQLSNELSFKIKELSKFMFLHKTPLEWQKEFWLECANRAKMRPNGLMAAKKYENFVKYQLEEVFREVGRMQSSRSAKGVVK